MIHTVSFKPHEDGPAYHPVVATLSLASHAVFHYYQYRSSEIQKEGEEEALSPRGRTIDPQPVMSIFLETRR